MRIKVGDRVRILDGKNNPGKYVCWVEGMDKYIGEVRTVEHVFSDYCELSDTNYSFVEEWLAPADDFTKDDLKEFDIVEFRNGRQALITMDIGFVNLVVCGFTFGTWNNDLKDNTGVDKYDIMKVYRPIDNIPTDRSKWKDLPVVYERTEVKEMTVEEISKALGYEVKVVK